METTEIATTLGYPTTTARRSLEDLNAHEVVRRTKGGDGKPDWWQLSAWAAERYVRAVGLTFPEKAEGESSSLINPNNGLEDFSGKPQLRLVDQGGVA